MLRKAKPIKVKLTIDDRPMKEDVLLLEIMNIGFVGPNLRLAPHADAGDGCFDVVLVPADSQEAMLEWIEEPERREAPVQVETGRRIMLQGDGLTLRVGDKAMREAEGEILIELEHPAVTLLVPSKPVKQKTIAPRPEEEEAGAKA